MHDVAQLALALGALALAMALGYAMGRARGHAVLSAYQQGQRDEHERMSVVLREHGSGGPCWVKSQVDAARSSPPDRPDER